MANDKRKGIGVNDLRAVLIEQKGRCAISGVPLDPESCSLDHIVPLSRRELSPVDSAANVWIVAKDVNRLKGALTYDELLALCRRIIAYESEARALMERILAGQIDNVPKENFDEWVAANCDDTGRLTSHS